MFLANFFNDLDKFNKLKTKRKNAKKTTSVYNTSSELHNNLIEIYFDEYYDVSDGERKNMEPKYDFDRLFLKT